MKTFITTVEQRNNLWLAKQYFKALPKSRIDIGHGGVSHSENPYIGKFCIGTHLSILLRLYSNNPRYVFSYRGWDKNNSNDLIEHFGITRAKIQKMSGEESPFHEYWNVSPKKVFKKLFKISRIECQCNHSYLNKKEKKERDKKILKSMKNAGYNDEEIKKEKIRLKAKRNRISYGPGHPCKNKKGPQPPHLVLDII